MRDFLAFFQILGESIHSLTNKYSITYRVFVDSPYQVEAGFYSKVSESFLLYHKWVLIFVNFFPNMDCYDCVLFLLQFVNMVMMLIDFHMTLLCICKVNPVFL